MTRSTTDKADALASFRRSRKADPGSFGPLLTGGDVGAGVQRVTSSREGEKTAS